MASTANVKIKVLWANEVREAARLMRQWHDCKDEDKQQALMAAAFNAALVALWGIGDDDAVVMLGDKDIQRMVHDSPQLELDTP